MLKIKSAPHTGTNALGRECKTFRTIYKVEKKDIGTKRDNMGGHGEPPLYIFA